MENKNKEIIDYADILFGRFFLLKIPASEGKKRGGRTISGSVKLNSFKLVRKWELL